MSDWVVPLTDVKVSEEDIAAVLDCLRSGWLTMGPRTADFEEAFAAYVGARHAVAVSSGTAALHLAVMASGLGPGDEMIVPGLTFVASASAARFLGAEPVLCEIVGPENLNLDPADVEARITPRTRAVMAVHFCGYPSDVITLRELCDARGLVLIEDCAQAIGATLDDTGRQVGTVGAMGCYSLFSKKQLCVGEGGVVTTDDDALAARVRSLRSHAMTSVTWDRHRGHAESYDIVDIGFNYRIDEPRAALARHRLERLDGDLARRRQSVRLYRDRLAGLEGIEVPWSEQLVEHSTHFAFPVLLRNRAARDAFRSALSEQGVQTTWYPALHRFKDYVQRYPTLTLPRVEDAADRHCALPLSSALTSDELDLVVATVEMALA
ncbi:MAG: DegT/DnrJ/EryC1/StrS family aminotransferase [Actinomycetota bacterium]|nr:DegT/DnrJ/EryC1/StrS family aminotransferase [Actinomycetota bacterium]